MTTSMTGFAAHSLNLDQASVNIDLRSVNQRYLELHFRLADEFRALEPQLRELIQQRLARGKVECRIGLALLPAAAVDNGLNPAILERLAHWQADVLQRLPDSARLSVNEILRWPGAVPAVLSGAAYVRKHRSSRNARMRDGRPGSPMAIATVGRCAWSNVAKTD